MLELLLLLLILAGFVYGILYLRGNDIDEEGNKRDDLDIIFITSIVLLCSAFVFGIIFSERFIKYLSATSKLASVGLMLSKIKGYFVGTSEQKVVSPEKIANMSGGGHREVSAVHNDMYEDDLPESDDEEDY